MDYQIDPRNPHRTTIDNEWLWNSTELAFNRQYADKLTQERVMAKIKAGIKMKGEELDDYISHFEVLVHHARLTINDQLVVDIFTAGLPYNMYKELYNIQPPLVMCEDWRTAAIEQQKRFIHLKGRQEGFKQRLEKFKALCNTQQSQRAPFGAPKYEPMDTSPGHTCHDCAQKGVGLLLFSSFLFSLYHHPESSGMFYDDPLTSAMTHTLDHSSMT